jgi:hypothetical protein
MKFYKVVAEMEWPSTIIICCDGSMNYPSFGESSLVMRQSYISELKARNLWRT